MPTPPQIPDPGPWEEGPSWEGGCSLALTVPSQPGGRGGGTGRPRTPRDQGKGLLPGKKKKPMSFLLHIPHPSDTGWVPAGGGPWDPEGRAGSGPGRDAKPCTAQPTPSSDFKDLRCLFPLPLTSSPCCFPLNQL